MPEETSTSADSRTRGVSVRLALGVTILTAVVAFGGGWMFAADKGNLLPELPMFMSSALGTDQPPAGVDFDPVWKAWRILDEHFVPAALGTTTAATSTPADRVWGMIQGMAASTGDPYTVFMPPVEAEEFQEDISGVFEGVGMEVDMRDGVLIVVSPLKGSPAERAGIQAKDAIVKIDGASTEGIDVSAAIKKIRGPRGSTVVLSIVHEGSVESKDVSVVRDVINVPIVKTERKGDVFVISLYSFTANSPTLFRNALREFISSGSNKLILDLRGNPGGYLEAAVEMASWFLPSGKVVVTEDYGSKQAAVPHRSRGYNIFNENGQIAILVNKGSASASEILAGALKEHGKAVLIGTTTFGKGSVQELVPITSDTALKVTVARWLLPGNVWIPSTGIEPNIKVDRTLDDIKNEKDPQMDRAIEFLRTGN